MKENTMGYSDEWQPYKGDYDKFEYDVKLKNGKILENCYPNADKFNVLSTNINVDGSDVKEIRFSNNPKSYLNIHVSEKSKNMETKEKFDIEVIPSEQTPKIETTIKNPKEWAENNKELIKAMTNFVSLRGAIGLAANQCSLNGERIMQKFFLERNTSKELRHCSPCDQVWDVRINPEIVEYIGMTDKCIEGCLTWTTKDVLAERYRQIKVKYYTIDGELKEETITGFRAHVWQHECNHLEGVEEKFYNPSEHGPAHTLNKKIQRNDDCPCGSGKKYKKCCGQYEITI